MIKIESTLMLNKDDESQLRGLLSFLNDFSMGQEITDTDKPEIREIVWSLQKKLKRAEAALTQSGLATAQRAAGADQKR